MTREACPPIVAHVLSRLVTDRPLNGELEALTGSWRRVVDRLVVCQPDVRFDVLRDCLTMRDDAEDVLSAIRVVDPEGPSPELEPFRAAHGGDLAAANERGRFIWPNWLVRSHFNLLSSDPKIGKTHIILDLARRFYFGLEFPDGAEPTFPAGTKVLWVCGDRHQDEIRERATAFGLPMNSYIFNALPSNPYGGCNLDDQENVDLMRRIIDAERPGLVAIDTLWRATRRQLRREEEVNALLDPILAIAQETDTCILGAMHLSKDGETLGRRVEGLARAVLKLHRPNPEGEPDRRRLSVIGNFREPPPLGVTLGTASCEYDSTPPKESAGGRTGRPSEARDRAKTFIFEALSKGGELVGTELAEKWEKQGESTKTFWRAVDNLAEAGEIIKEGGPNTRRKAVLRAACD